MAVENAQRRGWGTGWPNCHPELCVTVKGGGVRVTVRKEIATLVAWLLSETLRRGYLIRQADTGGFNCRQIRHTGIASNHSWGLAIDMNWSTNPATTDGGVHTDMPPWLIDLWESHGFRWGGHYTGSFKDTMHIEFMGTPADAARITAGIGAGTGPIAASASLPLRLHAGTAADPYSHGPVVETLQKNLNKWIAKHHPHGLDLIKVDGVYGRATALYVVAFKLWVISLQTAFHQPVWPNHDSTTGLVTYGGAEYWANH